MAELLRTPEAMFHPVNSDLHQLWSDLASENVSEAYCNRDDRDPRYWTLDRNIVICDHSLEQTIRRPIGVLCVLSPLVGLGDSGSRGVPTLRMPDAISPSGASSPRKLFGPISLRSNRPLVRPTWSETASSLM